MGFDVSVPESHWCSVDIFSRQTPFLVGRIESEHEEVALEVNGNIYWLEQPSLSRYP